MCRVTLSPSSSGFVSKPIGFVVVTDVLQPHLPSTLCRVALGRMLVSLPTFSPTVAGSADELRQVGFVNNLWTLMLLILSTGRLSIWQSETFRRNISTVCG